jgi:hypothetical protein
MSAPPKKKRAPEKSALQNAADTASVTQPLTEINLLQGWRHEGRRLLSEFWRTGNLKHLAAFSAHVAGMRARLKGKFV